MNRKFNIATDKRLVVKANRVINALAEKGYTEGVEFTKKQYEEIAKQVNLPRLTIMKERKFVTVSRTETFTMKNPKPKNDSKIYALSKNGEVIMEEYAWYRAPGSSKKTIEKMNGEPVKFGPNPNYIEEFEAKRHYYILNTEAINEYIDWCNKETYSYYQYKIDQVQQCFDEYKKALAE